ncbi:PREDICTED: vacuolar protein sorting-associated protein 11 homolog [Rhagoletis zephyria]|uniref:vacuolar protein sorting-associated protein 11 homolog n=1 Tax=Rhagoletis zephyria TaxID=28612 RepID=UPI000811A377|nr:PREDICTED: vacuolar protein sorting-associated protein 11 homolog [Rhagoletis zephyria]XP_036320520.1 vacuolar protein sorting-associated protein 11 homolog [Rhagoletis pomonella]
MSALEWRYCEFYDLALLSNFCKVDMQANIVAHCTNGSMYVFCDIQGVIHLCFKNSEEVIFRHHINDIQFCALTNNNEFLILVAQDDISTRIHVHVLNIDCIIKRMGPTCVGSAQLTSTGCVTAVNGCLPSDGLICISIGLDTGELLFHLSVLCLDMTPNFTCISTVRSRIIGIEFQEKMDILYMFVCAEKYVWLYKIVDNMYMQTILDAPKNLISCCAFQDNAENAYLLVGQEDAIYCFTIDGRGPCYAINGKKKAIASIKNNIVILIEPEEKRQNYVVIIDVNKKRIVFQKEIKNINTLVSNEMFCYIIIDNNIYITTERSIQCKLQVLMNGNLYGLALNEIDNRMVNLKGSVMLKYGNYLLNKGDLHSANCKYKAAIGLISSYLIIKKLIDSRYNSQLMTYINALAITGKAPILETKLFELSNRRENLKYKFNNKKYSFSNNNNTFLTIAENFNTKLVSSNIYSRYKSDGLYDQLIRNCPKTISEYWGKVFNALKMTENPEHSVSLLIASKDTFVELLEYLVSLSQKRPLVINLLLELLLFEWYNGNINVSEIIQFLEDYNTGYSDQIMVLFANYSFWPGVIYLHRKYKIFQLCLKYCIKYCDFDIPINLNKVTYLSPNLTVQAFETINCSSDDGIEFVDRIIGKVLRKCNQAMLQIVQGISIRKNFKVVSIKKMFNNKISENKLEPSITPLFSSLRALNSYLLNFRTRPIEVRENTCVICDHSLALPAIYFLCQHAFHVECIEHNLGKKNCPICPPNVKCRIR